LDEWVLCKIYEKSRKKKDNNGENIEAQKTEDRVPVDQCEGNSTFNIEPEPEPNSLEAYGNYSEATTPTWLH
jgi:hypothetical protein